MSTAKETYHDLIVTMRGLGAALIPATAAQYEAPPQSGASREKNEKGIKNPTLEIVLDQRRSALSDQISATATALRQANAILAPHVTLLQQAVARWEGSPEGLPAL